jgi:GNAT superfamily N-acetyltransferase
MAMTVFVTDNQNEEHIVYLLERFIDESVYKNPPVIKENIAKLLGNPDLLTIVAYQDDKPVGLGIAMHWMHPFFSIDFVTDAMLFVVPEARGTLIGSGFIKRIEEWAKKIGVDALYMGQSSGIGDYERMAEFYKKHGYEITGVNCKKDL